ncbi:MAG: redoxin domain-containing protein [Pirellulales bacterium]
MLTNWLKVSVLTSALSIATIGLLSLEAVAADGAAKAAIGSKIAGFELTDYRGRKWNSDELRGSRGTVFVFLGTQCPLAKIYSSRINQLEAEFNKSGISFVAVSPNVQDSLEMMAAFARKHKLEIPFLKDPDQALATALGATRTPEACVLDNSGKLVYRGRIDDQYGIGYVREAPKSSELKVALNAVVAGKSVPEAEVAAVGCLIGRRKAGKADGEITYTNQVARILQKRCVECHREGDIGPMDLTNYEDVAAWSDMMLEVIRDNRMPPWQANPAHGKFSNDRSLSADEKATLEKWVASGTPLGDISQLPEPLKFADGWQLPQEPDVVIPVSSEPFTIPAKGAVRYQYFQQALSFEEDKWIKAMEVKPGNRGVVHHILVFDRIKGTDGNIQGHRSFFAGYVPGTRAKPFAEGMAKRLPAGSELIFQVHYTTVGTEQVDQSHIGLVFEKDPSKLTHEIQTSSVFDARFRIPPKTSDYSVKAELDKPLPACDLLALSPHMHVRGKSYRYTAIFPDGRRQVLLDVPRYDFNWQNEYRLEEKLPIPAGTQILGEAVFDNSDENLNNPDPNQWVTFGEQTWEEMMIGYFHVAVPLDRDTLKAKVSVLPEPIPQRRRPSAKEMFGRMDRDQNGKLTKDEIPDRFRPLATTLDANNDGVITEEEFKLPNF